MKTFQQFMEDSNLIKLQQRLDALEHGRKHKTKLAKRRAAAAEQARARERKFTQEETEVVSEQIPPNRPELSPILKQSRMSVHSSTHRREQQQRQKYAASELGHRSEITGVHPT